MSSRTRLRKRDNSDHEQLQVLEAEVEIRLGSSSTQPEAEVWYDFKSNQYQTLPAGGFLINLLTLPSRVIHREELELQTMAQEIAQDTAVMQQYQQHQQQYQQHQQQYQQHQQQYQQHQQDSQQQQQPQDVTQDLEELYGSIMSAEQLAKLDSQPNPFNFSERVSQTLRIPRKTLEQQTDQPPSNTFGTSVGLSVIYDAYQRDYVLVLAREKLRHLEKEKEGEKENKSGKKSPWATPDTTPVPTTAALPVDAAQEGGGLARILRPTRIMERMVNQNIFDDVIHDYKYWEDTSDDFRPLEGSLLPLWKLTTHKTRDLLVADVCWSPAYPDLLAAAYMPDSGRVSEAGGFLCLYTLKNPGYPERCLPTPCGLTSVQFHPTRESVLVAGRSDGAVMVYDARLAPLPRVVASSTTTGKHLLPVCQVRWVLTEPGQNLSFCSVADDGRVSEWVVRPSALHMTDILDSKNPVQPSTTSPKSTKLPFVGTATCVSFKPQDKSILLVGLDSGVVLEMCLTSSSHAYTRYHAHTAPVTAIVWNAHHHHVFATCSLDWMLKIWLQHYTCALVMLDLGAPVSGMTWCYYSSSVIVGVTEDGRVHVYDLFLRKCRPLCVQNLLQRRRSSLACVALNPFHPILLVGGDRGYLLTLKLSPNLRRPHKEAKGADEQKLREIELAKIERIITTAKSTDNSILC